MSLSDKSPAGKLNPHAPEFFRSPAPSPEGLEKSTESEMDHADQFVQGLAAVHNLDGHAPWLASVISTLPTALADQTDSAASCSSCAVHVTRHRVMAEELAALRNGWSHEIWDHKETRLRLQGSEALVYAGDAAYQAITSCRDGMLSNGVPLSKIAHETIASNCDVERERAWQSALELTNDKLATLKQRSRGLIRANRKFCRLAGKYHSEMAKYERWLEERSAHLQKNHATYCELMREQNAEPIPLCGQNSSIRRARKEYVEAWDERQKAARQATETAYLDGIPDMFEGICDL